MLLTEKTRAESDSPFEFHHARAHEALAYMRFGRYTEEEIGKFDTALKEYQADKAITHLILDLRSPQAQAEFSIA
jgi:C-terminal processing protease CtpA/Prc